MVVAIKGKEAVTIQSHVPFIITSNKLPHFGTDAVNVERRLAIFKIKPLPVNQQFEGVLEVFREDCTNYIHWIALKITQYRHLVDPRELFYERVPSKDFNNLEKQREEMTMSLRSRPREVRAESFECAFTNGANDTHPVS